MGSVLFFRSRTHLAAMAIFGFLPLPSPTIHPILSLIAHVLLHAQVFVFFGLLIVAQLLDGLGSRPLRLLSKKISTIKPIHRLLFFDVRLSIRSSAANRMLPVEVSYVSLLNAVTYHCGVP